MTKKRLLTPLKDLYFAKGTSFHKLVSLENICYFVCYFGGMKTSSLHIKWPICLLSKGLLGHQKTCFRMKTVLAGLPLTIAANQNLIYELLTSFDLRIFFRPSVIFYLFHLSKTSMQNGHFCAMFIYICILFLLVLWYLCKNTHTLKPIT